MNNIMYNKNTYIIIICFPPHFLLWFLLKYIGEKHMKLSILLRRSEIAEIIKTSILFSVYRYY